jgi:hypothetical protein
VPCHCDGERQPAQVDDPVRRWDEERQEVVIEPVRAPEQRADRFADGREGDDAERLRTPLGRDPRQRREQDSAREHPECELLWIAREMVERE